MGRGVDLSGVEELAVLESLVLMEEKSQCKKPRKETTTTYLPLFRGGRWEVK